MKNKDSYTLSCLVFFKGGMEAAQEQDNENVTENLPIESNHKIKYILKQKVKI